ncbi:MAG: hypothetical protein JSU82_09535 [Rhodospirillales bacterium]|nr:MAG: hypothetical protein JSU82_09535 [Rhodospirillales bacterium]
MAPIAESVERHHRSIIYALLSLIALFIVACALDDLIPICHFIFGCDHGFHGSV